ncbi:Cerevisin [Dactylellina cionopaga]|nr:Cerevisin [Dactylellina cionopaga]
MKSGRFPVTLLFPIVIPAIFAIPTPLEGSVYGRSQTISKPAVIQQNNAPWSLQRISSPNTVARNGRNTTALAYNYEYDEAAMGTGVDVYVVDTGIDFKHPEFGERAKILYQNLPDARGDYSGHGTHVAGIIGSKSYGVAKNVNLLGVDPGYGGDQGIENSTIAINVVLANHNQRRKQKGFRGSVMNLSWGFDKNLVEQSAAAGFSGFDNKTLEGLKNALRMASNAGIHITVTPGNDNLDACENYPATFVQDVTSLISVGNSDITDTKASTSGWGRCVDLHAPGEDITSTYLLGFDGQRVLSGTSQAGPLVAGVIAGELIRRPDLMLKPAEMKQLILSKGLKGAVKGAERGGNILLNVGTPGNHA